MNENLIINNFGGIKNLQIELKSINLIIGPQASGKSVTVKLFYFFKGFFSEIYKSVENGETKRELDNRQIEKFGSYFPKDSWPKSSFHIEYRIGSSFIYISRKQSTPLQFNYSDNIKALLNKCRKIYREELKRDEQDSKSISFRLGSTSARSRYNKYLGEDISKISINNQIFIPAGRSFFANLQSGIFTFLSSNRSLDPFLVEFGSVYENFKRFADDEIDRKSRRNDNFNQLVSEILNGNYLREKEKDYLVHRDSRKVNLSNASSGQQETLPLIIILKALKRVRFTGGGATLYIEEPEAHLFPTAQKRIVELLAKIFNTINTKFQIIVTTHSPYILSSFNNLLEAGKILVDKPDLKDSIFEIIPEDEILVPNSLVAYSLINGEKSLLIDEQTRLISQNILDSVSDEISIEFGKLLDLEF